MVSLFNKEKMVYVICTENEEEVPVRHLNKGVAGPGNTEV